MNVERYAGQAAIGLLLTWLLQTNGLTRPLWQKHEMLEELGSCDLCLGFWVHLAIALVTKSALSASHPGLFGRIVYAAVSSFLAHLLRMGWTSKFGYTVIE